MNKQTRRGRSPSSPPAHLVVLVTTVAIFMTSSFSISSLNSNAPRPQSAVLVANAFTINSNNFGIPRASSTLKMLNEQDLFCLRLQRSSSFTDKKATSSSSVTSSSSSQLNSHDRKSSDGTISGDIGIAMAGGSFRAASTCFGVLRGFQQKKVTVMKSEGGESQEVNVPAMDLVKYNSGISGGSFPAILYTYAQVTSSDELLETHRTVDPSLITSDLLNDMPDTSMGGSFTKPNMNKVISTIISNIRPSNLFKVHSLWTGALYKKIFHRLNVPKNKFFTSGREELEQILNDNPNLKASDFLLPRHDVKTMPMILFTMAGSRFDNNKYMDNYVDIYNEAWKDYKAQETLEFFTNTQNRPNMTELVLKARDMVDEKKKIEYGGNLPMAYVATPSSVENKYTGIVKIRDEMVAFPEPPTKPFEWGAENRLGFGRNRRYITSAKHLIDPDYSLTNRNANFTSTSFRII